jgi:hypothetical protein
MRGRQIAMLAVAAAVAVAMPGITARPAMAADPMIAELTQETQLLADIVREGDEEVGLTNPPIMVSTNCNYQRQWWNERCSPDEALVPFTTFGPISAVWNYVALFRVLPKETAMEAEMRRGLHLRPKHVALVTFAFISEPLGLIDWKTAKVESGHVLVQTRHWTDRDGRANPSGAGVVRIDLDDGLKLTSLP